jgi:hypothetical protein
MTGNHILPFYVLGRIAIILTSLLNLVFIFQNKVFTSKEGDIVIYNNPITPTLLMKGRIALALIVACIGLVVRRKFFLVLSIVSFAWILGEYVRWWVRSYVLYKNIEEEGRKKIEHLLFLIGANWWDVWIFVVTVVALALTLIVLSKDNALSSSTSLN